MKAATVKKYVHLSLIVFLCSFLPAFAQSGSDVSSDSLLLNRQEKFEKEFKIDFLKVIASVDRSEATKFATAFNNTLAGILKSIHMAALKSRTLFDLIAREENRYFTFLGQDLSHLKKNIEEIESSCAQLKKLQCTLDIHSVFKNPEKLNGFTTDFYCFCTKAELVMNDATSCYTVLTDFQHEQYNRGKKEILYSLGICMFFAACFGTTLVYLTA